MTDPSQAIQAEAKPAGIQPLGSARGRYALSVLLVIYIFNFLDRQVVNILVEPIRNDLNLADWQMGMLAGLAFAVLYTTLGIPIARLAERRNRVAIISASVAVWSIFTALCGLAGNFAQLLAARIGVGVGEAGCTPSAHSLISDYVPREKRASALAFYAMGIPLGSLFGMALGGMVADAWGWRAAFFLAGAPGLVLAVVAFFTLPEPRKAVAGVERKADAAPTLREAMREIRSKTAFWWIISGGAVAAVVMYGNVAFYGSFFLRNHGPQLEQLAASLHAATGVAFGPTGFIGLALGLILGVFGAAGTYAGGVLTDWAVRRDARGYAWVAAGAAALTVPPFVVAFLLTDVRMALAMLTLPAFIISLWTAPVFASAQTLVQPRTRATASALMLFLTNLIGLGLGPLGVGLLSDALAVSMGPAEGVRWSIIIVGCLGGLAAIPFLMAGRSIRDQIVG